jgi:hypothetical protein
VTHILILQGTPTGAPLPTMAQATRVTNAHHYGGTRLDFRVPNELHPARVINNHAFGSPIARHKAVLQLSTARVANASTFGVPSLESSPFEPLNAETETLVAACTGAYDTIAKRQIDRLITELKGAGVWNKLDWYGNAHWATNEHDALLNWINPTQTLTKIGGASWTLGEGLNGVNPMDDSGRFKSGWNVGTGPHSTATSFAMFCKITAVGSPQDGMQPMGLFEYNTPGPSAPNGSWIILNLSSGTGVAGASCLPFNGNDGFASGDGTGLWCTSRNGNVNKTFRNGAEVDSDALPSGASGYTHSDGICVAGSGPGFLAQKSFPGTILYWGWSSALGAGDVSALEEAFDAAVLPPVVDDPHNTFIVVPSGAVSADLVNFPLIVDLGRLKSSFKTSLNSTAGNLRAYSGAALLNLDVLSWNGANGSAAIKIPTIAAGSDTKIDLAIDESATQPGVGTAGGRNGVWADYEFVLFGEGITFIDHAGKQTFTVDGTPADITSVSEPDPLFPAGKALRFHTGANLGGGDAIWCNLSGDLRTFTFGASLMLTFTSTSDNFGICSLYNKLAHAERKTMAWRGTDSPGQDGMQAWDSTNSWFKPASVFIPTANSTRFRAHLTYSGNASATRRQLWNGPNGIVASAPYSSHPIGDRFILGNARPSFSEPGNFQASFVYVRHGVLSDAWLRAEVAMLVNPMSIYEPQ